MIVGATVYRDLATRLECIAWKRCLEALSKASTRELPNLLVEQRCLGTAFFLLSRLGLAPCASGYSQLAVAGFLLVVVLLVALVEGVSMRFNGD